MPKQDITKSSPSGSLFPKWPLSEAGSAKFLLFVSTCSVLFSCYLLYVLKVILKDFCVVCTTFHLINFSTFFFAALPNYRAAKAKAA